MKIMDKGEDYLRQYPKAKKWINTCICCGAKGYRPDMPEVITKRDGTGEYETCFARYLRKYFQPLAVDEHSLCEVCAKLIKKENNKNERNT